MTCREVKLTQQPKLTVGEESWSLGLSYTLDSTACLLGLGLPCGFFLPSFQVGVAGSVCECWGLGATPRLPEVSSATHGKAWSLNEAMQQDTAHCSQYSRRCIASHFSTGVNLLCLFWSSHWNIAITGHEGEAHQRWIKGAGENAQSMKYCALQTRGPKHPCLQTWGPSIHAKKPVWWLS